GAAPCSEALRGASPASCAGSSNMPSSYEHGTYQGMGYAPPRVGLAPLLARDSARTVMGAPPRATGRTRDRSLGGGVGYPPGMDPGPPSGAPAPPTDTGVEMVTRGDRSVSTPAVVYPREDGALVCGDAAARRAVSNPDRIGREFKRR